MFCGHCHLTELTTDKPMTVTDNAELHRTLTRDAKLFSKI